MIKLDHEWLTNPFALKEIVDIFLRIFGNRSKQTEKTDETEKKVGASIFTKEDESEFETLMSKLELFERSGGQDLRELEPHKQVNRLLVLLKEHQSDDLRYTVVKMDPGEKHTERRTSRKEVHVGDSPKGPRRDEVFEEFVLDKMSKRFTVNDQRILYLIYLAQLVKEYGPGDVLEILIARRVIKRTSVAEDLKAFKDWATAYLKDRWHDIDVAIAERELGDDFEDIYAECELRGFSDEATWKTLADITKLRKANRLQSLRKTRQGSLRKSDWLWLGILSGISVLGVIAIVIKSM